MTDQPQRITLRRPDDWHLHLRTGAMLKVVLPHSAAQLGRAIVMPNLAPPVVDTARAEIYRDEILAALPAGSSFRPLMTAYLTDGTDADDIEAGHAKGVFTAVKLYPAHATTNSAHGVTDFDKVAPVLDRMAKIGMPLLVHGEVTDQSVDIFDREAVFIDTVLPKLMGRHPDLKIVLEHITTEEGVAVVHQHGPGGKLAATITAHHLMINRSSIFVGGIRPHLYCLPIAKREKHRLALRAAATSGEPWFFFGTDSAPHPIGAKESACGCAGIYTAATAVELYTQVFDEEGALDKLEAFASLNGPAFYGLPVNESFITLEKSGLIVPDVLDVGGNIAVLPFRSGERLDWRLV
ncbi:MULTISPECIES: dihydroorotase [unclassified Azospirillum]|uniref:dihydroorotase n=1 Tax=unclassified Azospirillum TaxID=2630922 RepID=UPI000B741A25|nr:MULTISPECIES: dihydroorotase [unclassified Azospirillum]SNR86655.1 dihydroorotase [Azospirillum sp. RU38E]SNS02789.1 dihydroorotase [Azospirillum sp. RU37A]